MIVKTLPTIWQIKIIDNKKVAKVTLDKNIEIFVVYIIIFNLKQIIIFLAEKAEIIFLNIIKTFKNILAEYSNYGDIFYKKFSYQVM